MSRFALIAAVSSFALAGCMTTGSASSMQEHPGAHAQIQDARGQDVAIGEVGQEQGELYVGIDVSNLPPGRYAVHIHAVGRCDGPGFESAGPHWNPTGVRHGFHGDDGTHLGDLPTIAVNARRRGVVAMQIQNATLTGGPNALLDADGAAIVIHAGEDDYVSDPSGNSGARIACGVLRMSG
jgi:superoxide dismutase, Cu-Zn family